MNIFAKTLVDNYSAENLRGPLGQFEYGERLIFTATRGGSVEVAHKLFQLGVDIGTKTRLTSGCLSRDLLRSYQACESLHRAWRRSLW